KSVAYALQVAAVVVFTLLLLAFGKPRARARKVWVLVVAYVFVLAALLSAWASLTTNGVDYFALYLFATLFYVAVLVIYALFEFEAIRRASVGTSLSLLGLLLVGVAVAQQ
uniref:hypothetical protein n=1 Tax=Campylobacter coli TaxID=195 RepID=UPI003CF74FAB